MDVEASFKFEIHGVLGVIFAESRTSLEVRCNDRIVHENRKSYIWITFSFRMMILMICCNPFGVSTPHPWDKQTALRGAWLGTTSGSLAQLGGGHIPSTCTCSLGFSWVQGGCSWGVGCFAKNPSFLEAYEVV